MSDRREDTDRIPELDSRQGADAAHDRVPAHDDSATPTRQWSRRRFGKTALGITPVIATLYGRPLWAARNCAPSGWVSGNTSVATELENCGGTSAGNWGAQDFPNQDAPLIPDANNGTAGEQAAAFPGLNSLYDRLEVLDNDTLRPATLKDAVRTTPIVQIGGISSMDRKILRFGTAAVLSARHNAGYMLAEGDGSTPVGSVSEIVVTTLRLGGYTTNTGDTLTREQVKSFLENTLAEPYWP